MINEQTLSRGLAYFSFGLGVAELVAPRQVARLVGVDESHARLIQLCGMREIGAGFGIMQYKPSAFLWSRVAGDALDLGLLAMAYRAENSDRRRVRNAMIAVAAVTALDVVASILRSRDGIDPSWRIESPDRAGIGAGDPVSRRREHDEISSRYEATSNAAQTELLAGA